MRPVAQMKPGRRRRSRWGRGLIGLGASVALALSGCGTAGSGGSGPGFNAAIGKTVAPSTAKGGTITFDQSSVPDSTDPGNTYYAYNWDFTRLYATPLMTYKSCPGACGEQLVPALATAPGTVSDGGLTWTYHIKPNVKFENGVTVTTADIKYAVERTFDKTVLPNGPTYYQVLLAGNASTYPGPYKDKTGTLTAVDTPNATTIVFHLNQPFADFNYVAAIPQSAPVLPSADTGVNYQLHPLSTGPYKFASYALNKQMTLVPNPEWNPSTDPQVKQLASKIIVNYNVNANDIDSRLIAGDIQMDEAGSGVQAAARARILSSPSLTSNADDPVTGFMWFFYVNTVVAPLNNVHCREAVEYAANKTNLQTAQGGPDGGSIASTAMPPTVIGYQKSDMYNALTMPNGDLAAARQQLALCGQPNGFTTGIAYRADRPREVAAAQALQASLALVGIKTTLHGYPSGEYYSNYAGVPTYVHSHDLGLLAGGWGADWPDAWGWFDEITNGNAIAPAGNTNIEELNDPVVNSDLAAMQAATNPTVRNSYANKIDTEVMKDAAILPEVYSKALLYRSPDLTNIYVQQYYGMYNYGVLGTKS
jgi:peptide/nickel transport system substrate-binding protein